MRLPTRHLSYLLIRECGSTTFCDGIAHVIFLTRAQKDSRSPEWRNLAARLGGAVETEACVLKRKCGAFQLLICDLIGLWRAPQE